MIINILQFIPLYIVLQNFYNYNHEDTNYNSCNVGWMINDKNDCPRSLNSIQDSKTEFEKSRSSYIELETFENTKKLQKKSQPSKLKKRRKLTNIGTGERVTIYLYIKFFGFT